MKINIILLFILYVGIQFSFQSVDAIHVVQDFFQLPHLTRENFSSFVDTQWLSLLEQNHVNRKHYEAKNRDRENTTENTTENNGENNRKSDENDENYNFPTKYILFYQPFQLDYIPGLFEWYKNVRDHCTWNYEESTNDSEMPSKHKENLSNNHSKYRFHNFIMAVDAATNPEIPFRFAIRVTEPLLWEIETDQLYKFSKPQEIYDAVSLLTSLKHITCQQYTSVLFAPSLYNTIEEQQNLNQNQNRKSNEVNEKIQEKDIWRPKAGLEKNGILLWSSVGICIYLFMTFTVLYTVFMK